MDPTTRTTGAPSPRAVETTSLHFLAGADPTLDWGLASHLQADGSPRIVERQLTVPPELAGLRLDHFIKTQIDATVTHEDPAGDRDAADA